MPGKKFGRKIAALVWTRLRRDGFKGLLVRELVEKGWAMDEEVRRS
jgi:predicted DNA-binding transcriptional regulator